MKSITLIISIAVFAWLLVALAHAFGWQIPPLVAGYLLLYAVSSLGAQIILGRTAGGSSEYLARFVALLLPVVIVASVLVVRFCLHAHVLPAALLASLTYGTMLWHVANSRVEAAWRGAVPAQVDWTIFFAAAFSTLGVLAFVSVLTATNQKEEILRTALCAHWTLYGGFLFAYSTGVLRDRGAWIQRGEWMSAVIGIAAYAWLAWQLSGVQMELSRQGTAQVCADERTAVVAVMERRGQ